MLALVVGLERCYTKFVAYVGIGFGAILACLLDETVGKT